MNDRLANSWARGCLTGIGLRLTVAFGVLGAAGCCLTLSLMVPVPFEQKLLIAVGGFLAIFFFILIGILIWGIGGVRKRASSFDEGFTPYGLVGQHYLTNGRQYHGQINGRQIDVYFSRGPHLEMHVAANINTRLGIGLTTAVGRAAGDLLKQTPLTIADPTFQDLIVSPEDEPWARGLLESPQVRKDIRQLMGDAQTPGLRALQIGPNALSLTLRRVPLSNLTPTNIRIWLDTLLQLASQAESQPAPEKISSESDFVRRARSERSKTVGPLAILVVALVVILPVFLVAAFFGVLALIGQFP